MKNHGLLLFACIGTLLSTACVYMHNHPTDLGTKDVAALAITKIDTGASGVEKPETLRPCDGNDLPFLVAWQGAIRNPDFPGLNGLPVLVVDPGTEPVTPSRTKWIDASDNNWSPFLARDLDAISLGLDWLPFRHNTDDVTGKVVSWSPEIPPAGFASIFFVQEGAVWAYSWGPNLVELFPSDWTTFLRSTVRLHSRASMATPLGGIATGLDFNGGFQGAWMSASTCFAPPGSLPSSGAATLFYSTPGGLLFTSRATASASPPVGGPVWTWSTGTAVELLLSTASGSVPLFPEGSGADLVAFSYDRFNRIVMYSTSDATSPPFMMADVTEGLSAEGVVVELVLSNNQPLLDYSGALLGGGFSARPSGSCGIDPRRILGWELPLRQPRRRTE